jgi:hypothetical protein
VNLMTMWTGSSVHSLLTRNKEEQLLALSQLATNGLLLPSSLLNQRVALQHSLVSTPLPAQLSCLLSQDVLHWRVDCSQASWEACTRHKPGD